MIFFLFSCNQSFYFVLTISNCVFVFIKFQNEAVQSVPRVLAVHLHHSLPQHSLQLRRHHHHLHHRRRLRHHHQPSLQHCLLLMMASCSLHYLQWSSLMAVPTGTAHPQFYSGFISKYPHFSLDKQIMGGGENWWEKYYVSLVKMATNLASGLEKSHWEKQVINKLSLSHNCCDISIWIP